MLNFTNKSKLLILLTFFFLSTSTSYAIISGPRDSNLESNSVLVIGDDGSFCTGVVVSRNHILTAAFCVVNKGQIKITAKFNDNYIPPIIPSEFFIHPEYVENAHNLRRRSIPLAIIRTKNPLPAFLKPISIAIKKDVYDNDFLRAGGYGIAAEGNLATSGTFRSVILEQSTPFGPSKVLYWLVPMKGEAGACSGDAGGPVVYKNELVGIIMWSEGDKSMNRKCGTLTQAIKMSIANEWISEILQR